MSAITTVYHTGPNWRPDDQQKHQLNPQKGRDRSDSEAEHPISSSPTTETFSEEDAISETSGDCPTPANYTVNRKWESPIVRLPLCFNPAGGQNTNKELVKGRIKNSKFSIRQHRRIYSHQGSASHPKGVETDQYHGYETEKRKKYIIIKKYIIRNTT